jgi:hypothetical protein
VFLGFEERQPLVNEDIPLPFGLPAIRLIGFRRDRREAVFLFALGDQEKTERIAQAF